MMVMWLVKKNDNDSSTLTAELIDDSNKRDFYLAVLDDAINKFNEACVLAKTCDEKLKNATDSINKILNEDGSLKEFTIEE